MYFYTKTADWRSPIPFWRVSIYILEGANLHFVGRNWVLYRKGVIPKKGGTLDSRAVKTRESRIEKFQNSRPGVREEHSMDRYRFRPELAERLESRWSI